MRQVVTALLMFSALGAARGADALKRFVFEKAEMGVPFRITLYAVDEDAARPATNAAFERVELLNSILSDYDPDSELSRLSLTSGQGKTVPVSGDLWRVLEVSQRMAERTEGAFDITVGPLVNLWRRARQKHELPSPELIAEMRRRVGYRQLQLDPKTKSTTLLAADMRLDVGGIAKGYAADEALKVLKVTASSGRSLPRVATWQQAKRRRANQAGASRSLLWMRSAHQRRSMSCSATAPFPRQAIVSNA